MIWKTLLYFVGVLCMPILLLAQKTKKDSLFVKDSLEEVLVSSKKTRYVLTNPMAITKISQKQIEKTISSNIVDVLVANTPGLNAVKTGPNVSKPFIRGLGYNRVLTMYDGIRQEGQQWGDEHGIEIDGYHIANAEVIKGPASMLYGSDALAGVIAMQPVNSIDQKEIWKGNVVSEYHSNNNMVGNGIYIGYKKNRFFASANGSYKFAKNYQNK
ncbi:MAG: TonB-dependent receptor, partial [Pseudopedobacter saltans]